MNNKQASSQAAWALLMEGVSQSRVDAHRLNHLINRAIQLIEASDEKEHLYQIAGDIILGAPKRLKSLERNLDRTSLALSKMGSEFLSARLPLSDKTMVDEAIEAAFGSATLRNSDVEKLARRFMLADIKSKYPKAPEILQDVLAKLDKSGAKYKKISDWYRWEWSGDYSYVAYHPDKPNQINVSGKKGSKAWQWFAHHPAHRKFKMNVMVSDGSDGPTQWQYKLK